MARHLRISDETATIWSLGAQPIPDVAFLKIVDLLLDEMSGPEVSEMGGEAEDPAHAAARAARMKLIKMLQ